MRSPSHNSDTLNLSSIGEDIEWSPRERSPAAKKKGFVKLSNYDNQCFSTHAQEMKEVSLHSRRNSSIARMPSMQKSMSLKSKTNKFEDIDAAIVKMKVHAKQQSISPVKKAKSPGGNNAGIGVRGFSKPPPLRRNTSIYSESKNKKLHHSKQRSTSNNRLTSIV